MALAAGLTDLHVLVVDVGNLADGSHAGLGDVAQLARGQPQQGHAVLLGHQLGHDAGGPGQLSALAGVQLHVVDEGAHGDVLQGQGVAGLDVGLGAGDHLVPGLQAVGSQDILLLAVGVLEQGDEGGAVGIVLDGEYGGLHAFLLPLKIDDAVLLAVAAAPVADGDAAVAVAAGVLLQGSQQALLRALFGQDGVVCDRHVPPGRGSRLVTLDCHVVFTLLVLALRGAGGAPFVPILRWAMHSRL